MADPREHTSRTVQVETEVSGSCSTCVDRCRGAADSDWRGRSGKSEFCDCFALHVKHPEPTCPWVLTLCAAVATFNNNTHGKQTKWSSSHSHTDPCASASCRVCGKQLASRTRKQHNSTENSALHALLLWSTVFISYSFPQRLGLSTWTVGLLNAKHLRQRSVNLESSRIVIPSLHFVVAPQRRFSNISPTPHFSALLPSNP